MPYPGLEPGFSDSLPSVQGTRPVLLKLQLVSESSRGLVKTQVAGPYPQSDDSVGLGGA